MTKNKLTQLINREAIFQTPSEMIDVSSHSDKPGTKFTPGILRPLFLPTLWNGILPTFRCESCGYCDESKDEMILHVLTHVPERDRNALLDRLTKE